MPALGAHLQHSGIGSAQGIVVECWLLVGRRRMWADGLPRLGSCAIVLGRREMPHGALSRGSLVEASQPQRLARS